MVKILKVYVLGIVGFVLMFSLNFLVSILFIFLKPSMRKITLRRFAGFMMTYEMTPWVELKFDFARMLTYFPFLLKADDRLFTLRSGMRTADEMIGTPRVPTDDIFISHVILRSPLAFYTTNESSKLVVDLSAIDDVIQYPNTYYELDRIEVQKSSNEISLFMKSSDPTKPATRVSRKSHGDAVFERAMQSAMNTITYFIPGIGHSWVHFLFPDAVAATVHNDVPRRSVLYKLLEPHVRYTSRINWEALGVRGNLIIGGSALVRMAAEASTTSPRGVPAKGLTKKFEPWTPFPITSHEFVRKNSERTTGYYFSDDFACPPKWLNGPSAEIPYIKSMKRFYPVVREHVARVLEFEDKANLDGFIAAVDDNSRIDNKSLRLDRFDPIDVVATLIFDAMIIHSTDHHFTHKVFAETRYGVATLRHPYTRDWYPGSRVPEDMQDPEDRIRYAAFADIFVKFNDNWLWSNGLKSLRYGFRQRALRTAARDFINEIVAEQDKMQSDGDIFCPIKKLSKSICF